MSLVIWRMIRRVPCPSTYLPPVSPFTESLPWWFWPSCVMFRSSHTIVDLSKGMRTKGLRTGRCDFSSAPPEISVLRGFEILMREGKRMYKNDFRRPDWGVEMWWWGFGLSEGSKNILTAEKLGKRWARRWEKATEGRMEYIYAKTSSTILPPALWVYLCILCFTGLVQRTLVCSRKANN